MIFLPKTPEQKEFLMAWAKNVLDGGYYFEPYPVGFFRNDRIAAVVIIHDWRGPNVMWSAASINPRWCTKENLQWLYWYSFSPKPIGLGVSRVTALVNKTNKRCRKLLEGIGFKLEGVMRKSSIKGDTCIYGLLRNELKIRNMNLSVEAKSEQVKSLIGN